MVIILCLMARRNHCRDCRNCCLINTPINLQNNIQCSTHAVDCCERKRLRSSFDVPFVSPSVAIN